MRGLKTPSAHSAQEDSEQSPWFINFALMSCTKGRGKAAFACKWLPSLRRERDRLALQGLSGVLKTNCSTGKPKQTESHVPAQETSGEEQPHESSLGTTSVWSAWSGSPPRPPQGVGSPPSPVPSWMSWGCPPPATAWGQPGWAAAPAGPIHAPLSLCPRLSWKPDANSEYTLGSSGDMCACISSPSCMC